MTDLTAAQLEDFRDDIGDVGTTPAFTDYELQRLYHRAEDNYYGAVIMAIRQLRANAAKFVDYTANQSEEKRSQVFAQLGKLLDDYAKALAEENADGGKQVRIVGMWPVPPRDRAKPGS
jgi:hypothetical protein